MELFSISDLCEAVDKTKKSISGQGLLMGFTYAKEQGGNESVKSKNIEYKRKELDTLLDEVLPKILAQIELSKQVLETYLQWNKGYMDYRAGILSEISSLEEKQVVNCASLEALVEQHKELCREKDACIEEIAERVRKVNRKCEKVNKYCWVPFYSLYLLDDYENEDSKYNERLKVIQKDIERIENEINEVMGQASFKEDKQHNMLAIMDLLNKDSFDLNKKINETNRNMYEWNQNYDFFLRLKTDLVTLDELEEPLAKAIKHLTEVEKNQKEMDYSILEVKNHYLGNYVIKSPDGKVACVCNNMQMTGETISSSERSISEVMGAILTFGISLLLERHHKIKPFLVITLLNGKSLIVNKDFYVAHYDSAQSVYFDNLILEEDGLISGECFDIVPDSENDDLVKIVSCESGLCMNITSIGIDDNRICLSNDMESNNTKFVLEKND